MHRSITCYQEAGTGRGRQGAAKPTRMRIRARYGVGGQTLTNTPILLAVIALPQNQMRQNNTYITTLRYKNATAKAVLCVYMQIELCDIGSDQSDGRINCQQLHHLRQLHPSSLPRPHIPTSHFWGLFVMLLHPVSNWSQ
jgi:hypothetical protein